MNKRGMMACAWLFAIQGCSPPDCAELNNRIVERGLECGLEFHYGEGEPTTCPEADREHLECFLACLQGVSCTAFDGGDPEREVFDVCNNYCGNMAILADP